MNVLAYDPYINEERAKALGVKVATFDEVIENSDFITVHMPLTKETKGMIAMEQMKKMKPGIRLVNCARGGIIDEADLAEALKQGLVAAAAIDVYTSEPPAEKGNPLLTAPNIVLTPHLGASTVEAQIGVSVDVAKGIIAALHGGRWRRLSTWRRFPRRSCASSRRISRWQNASVVPWSAWRRAPSRRSKSVQW